MVASKFLFVYGTLKQGEVNHHHWLAPYIRNAPPPPTSSGCCLCYLQFVGTARTKSRYPFFTNVGAGEGTCAPCVVDTPIHDDDLSKMLIPMPQDWQGCAATEDAEFLANQVCFSQPTRRNNYYNNFPQRVVGEVYAIHRCAHCASIKTSSSEGEMEQSQMLNDFDELECTREGLYARRPCEVELLIRSNAEASTATKDGTFIASGPSGFSVKADGPQATRGQATSALAAKGVAAAQHLAQFTTAGTLIAGEAMGSSSLSPSTALVGGAALSAAGQAATASSVGNVPLTADIYFRTDKYPRAQLVEMLKRCVVGPAKTKMEDAVGQLVTPEQQQQQQQPVATIPRQHLQGFLSNFSAARSLSLSYPTHFSYIPPHMRSVQPSLPSDAPLSDADASRYLRRLPPSVLKSQGMLPPPMVLVILDGMGDYSGHSAKEACLADDGGNDVQGGGHGHGNALPIKAGDTNYDSLPYGLQMAGTFSPLELASIIKLQNDATSSDGLHVITRNGRSGTMDSVRSGLACGSDTAHLNLLGFDPREYYRGRGSFETIGSGLIMKAGDIAFKCNFATMAHDSEGATAPSAGSEDFFSSPTSTPLVVNRRADREFTREGPILCEALNGLVLTHDLNGNPFKLAIGNPDTKTSPSAALRNSQSSGNGEAISYEILVRYATEHRCGVVLRGPYLSDAITGTDPLVNNKSLMWCSPVAKLPLPQQVADLWFSYQSKAGLPITEEAKELFIKKDRVLWAEYNEALLTSQVVNAASAAMTRVLMHHDINLKERLPAGKSLANVVLLRGAAKLSDKMPSFTLRHGMRPIAVAPTAIIKGLAITAGFSLIDPVEGATGGYDSKLVNKSIAVEEFFADQQRTFGELFKDAFGEDGGRAQQIISRIRASKEDGHHTGSNTVKEVGGSVNRNRQTAVVEMGRFDDDEDKGGSAVRQHSGSPRRNVAGGRPFAAEEELINISAIARLASFVEKDLVDFVFLHVKGTDDAGHDKDLPKRVAMARKAGQEVLQHLWDTLPVGSTIAVTADHSTPVTLGDHSTESVPFSVAKKVLSSAASSANHDGALYFSEASCELYGSLGRFHGEQMLTILKRAHETQ